MARYWAIIGVAEGADMLRSLGTLPPGIKNPWRVGDNFAFSAFGLTFMMPGIFTVI